MEVTVAFLSRDSSIRVIREYAFNHFIKSHWTFVCSKKSLAEFIFDTWVLKPVLPCSSWWDWYFIFINIMIPFWRVGETLNLFLLFVVSSSICLDCLDRGPIYVMCCVWYLHDTPLDLCIHHWRCNRLSKVWLKIFVLATIVSFEPIIPNNV